MGCCAGTDTAKEAADVVMLDKNLATVCDGVLIGRKTYGNTIKCARILFAVFLSRGRLLAALTCSLSADAPCPFWQE